MQLLILVVMFGAIYYLLFRPQRKRMQEHQKLLRDLEEGDVVVTSSGIFGAIAELEESVVWLEVAPDIELKIARSAVAERVEEHDDDDDFDDEAEEDEALEAAESGDDEA